MDEEPGLRVEVWTPTRRPQFLKVGLLSMSWNGDVTFGGEQNDRPWSIHIKGKDARGHTIAEMLAELAQNMAKHTGA